MRRSGVSHAGVMVAVVALGMVASMGLLRYSAMRTEAAAATVVADLRMVARAALAYEANTGSWPPDADRGQVPPGLNPFLPAIQFTSTARSLEWDKFGTSASGAGYIAGITLSASDRRLVRRVIGEMRGEFPYFVAGGLVTWVLPTHGEEIRAVREATGD